MERRDPHILHWPIVWDLTIAALLIGPPLGAAWLFTALPGPLGWIPGGLLILGSVIVAYGSFIEPQLLTLNKKIIQIKELPPLTFAIAGDFHVGPYKKAEDVRRVVKTINKQQPDLVLLSGDFLFDHLSEITLLEPLKDLHARYGVWACIGNHDSGDHATIQGERYVTEDRSDEVSAFLRERGINVVRDEWVECSTENGALAIAGTDGPWANTMDLEKTFSGLPEDMPVILLAHNPDVVLNPLHNRAALIISGHTHGGQIRLPVIGALHIPAETGKKYDQGIFTLSEKTTLAVTKGCGETMARSRLLCVPEVLLVENRD